MYSKSIFKQKNYWIGVGVGIATVLIYQKFFKKEKTSSADGDRFGDNQYGQGACSSSDDTVCTQYCESVGGEFDSNNRKCYIEGVAYTGGYFSGGKNRSKLQR